MFNTNTDLNKGMRSEYNYILVLVCMLLNSVSFAQVLRPDTNQHKQVILTIEGGDTAAFAAIPDSKGFLNDFENVFNRSQRDSLLKLYNKYKAYADSNQFTIVTINDYAPYKDITEVAEAFGDVWQLGIKKKNGVMIIFSPSKKQARIQAGEGLQDKLNDNTTKYILNNYMVPEFRNKNYCRGTYNALSVILQVLYAKK